MRPNQPALFKGRHFEAEIIILCVRRYLRFALSYRNLEELMAERSLSVDHVTIWRWVQRYGPRTSNKKLVLEGGRDLLSYCRQMDLFI
jgi:transposase, IS6 family